MRKNEILINISLNDLSKILGISYMTLWNRYTRGCDIFSLCSKTRLTVPVGDDTKLIHNPSSNDKKRGRVVETPLGLLTIRELSQKTNIPYQTLIQRYRKGLRGDDLITKRHLHNVLIDTDDYGKVTFKQLSELTGINVKTLEYRYTENTKKDFYKTKPKFRVNHDIDENLSELAALSHLPYKTVYSRYMRGLRGYDLIQPVRRNTFKEACDRRCRPVIKYDLTGRKLKEYDSMIEASKDLDINPVTVRNILVGKTVGKGYILKLKTAENVDED